MIEIKNLKTGMSYTEFVKGITPNVPTWVICTNPTKEDIDLIHSSFGIPYEDLEDALDEDERPRLEIDIGEDPEYIKVVVRVPFPEDKMHEVHARGIRATDPAVVFLSEDHIISIQSHPIATKRIRKPIGSRRPRSTPTSLVLLDWLECVVKSFELAVDIIDRKLEMLEHEIFRSSSPSSAEEVFRLSRDSTYLDAALKGNLRVFHQLQKIQDFAKKPDLCDDLEDLSIDLQQQAELIEIYRELIESSLDAYASVISNNLNALLKVLASISLILMIPTLIASLYGMNLALPFENEPFAFWFVLIVSAILILPTWFFLKKTNLM
ncbi:magnesium transporter CorA family protein [[Eubacterium] cellulosolvens]